MERTGSVGEVGLGRARNGEGHLTARGYRQFSTPERGNVFEHTIIMESKIGRKLESHESVHHKNGDRGDNRPENLELWSTKQPYGQRVEDKLVWAKEIVALYG